MLPLVCLFLPSISGNSTLLNCWCMYGWRVTDVSALIEDSVSWGLCESYRAGTGLHRAQRKNSTVKSAEGSFTFASSLLHLSPTMNISSPPFIIPFFIIPVCLSAAGLHCHAPSLLHRRASSFCYFALVMYVHMSLIPSRSLFLFHFHLSVGMKITSVADQQKCKTLKGVPVRAVCAIMRLISLDNDDKRCRQTWSSTSMGHFHRSTEATVQSMTYFCPLPTQNKLVLACTFLWKVICLMSLRINLE